MTTKIGVVDLFAGPGGLGEGFSAAGAEDGDSMRIRLSVEADDRAVRTLRLRAFLRTFGEDFPCEYYDAINRGEPFPDWSEIYPAAWKLASDEVRHMTLGSEGAFDALAPSLDTLNKEHEGNTVLIGGPPCQAYSIVGRSRNRGKADYVPELDGRHYLYTEYVRILHRLKPAVFVMENVKGLLSSKVDGGRIVERVLDDLEGAGYRLVPVSSPFEGLVRPEAPSFLVQAEDHGVPQTRHRMFVVGVRSDLARHLDRPLLSQAYGAAPSCLSVIGDLAPLRSGLSYRDSAEDWTFHVRRQADRIIADPEVPDDVRGHVERLLAEGLGHLAERVGHELGQVAGAGRSELTNWIKDPRLERITHHETRSHIPDDLGRYLFAAVFGRERQKSPRLRDFPERLKPLHENRDQKVFLDRFRVQLADRPAGTVTSHIAKDGHYFIHPDPMQCRALTVREAARIQTFPDNYFFAGNRTEQYRQVGNAVPPFLARQIARSIRNLLKASKIRANEVPDQPAALARAV